MGCMGMAMSIRLCRHEEGGGRGGRSFAHDWEK